MGRRESVSSAIFRALCIGATMVSVQVGFADEAPPSQEQLAREETRRQLEREIKFQSSDPELFVQAYRDVLKEQIRLVQTELDRYRQAGGEEMISRAELMGFGSPRRHDFLWRVAGRVPEKMLIEKFEGERESRQAVVVGTQLGKKRLQALHDEEKRLRDGKVNYQDLLEWRAEHNRREIDFHLDLYRDTWDRQKPMFTEPMKSIAKKVVAETPLNDDEIRQLREYDALEQLREFSVARDQANPIPEDFGLPFKPVIAPERKMIPR